MSRTPMRSFACPMPMATASRNVPKKFVDLPAGSINHHWTKDIVAPPDGTRLYATVGSNSDHGERGIELERDRACVLEVDLATRRIRTFASGLRNPNGLSWNPASAQLWVAVNERDELGSDLVPDYITSVRDGAFYGWPYSYYGQHVDARVKPQRPDLVASAVAPDYAVGNHAGSLGLAFYRGDHWANCTTAPSSASTDRGIASRRAATRWSSCRSKRQAGGGAGGRTHGFLDDDGAAHGRPVGVAIDRQRRIAGGGRRRQHGLARHVAQARERNKQSTARGLRPPFGVRPGKRMNTSLWLRGDVLSPTVSRAHSERKPLRERRSPAISRGRARMGVPCWRHNKSATPGDVIERCGPVSREFRRRSGSDRSRARASVAADFVPT